jgi:hypothetical protein
MHGISPSLDLASELRLVLGLICLWSLFAGGSFFERTAMENIRGIHAWMWNVLIFLIGCSWVLKGALFFVSDICSFKGLFIRLECMK